MSQPRPEQQLVPGKLRLWRFWSMDAGVRWDSEPSLKGLRDGQAWETGVIEAQCDPWRKQHLVNYVSPKAKRAHEEDPTTPAFWCKCGIFGTFDPMTLITSGQFNVRELYANLVGSELRRGRVVIIGEVEAWGRCIKHKDGIYRTQFVEVKSLVDLVDREVRPEAALRLREVATKYGAELIPRRNFSSEVMAYLQARQLPSYVDRLRTKNLTAADFDKGVNKYGYYFSAGRRLDGDPGREPRSYHARTDPYPF